MDLYNSGMDIGSWFALIMIGAATGILVFKVLSDEMYKRTRQAIEDDREEQKATRGQGGNQIRRP